jgi:deoxycytidylate deaminase
MQARYKNRAERVFMHAEIHALVRARQDLSGCSITIGRAHKNGLTFGDTRPCNGCRDAIKDEGIRAVNYYYGGRFETEYF